MEAAKCFVVVTAGIIPEQVEAAHTRRWAITSSQWDTIVGGDLSLYDRVLGEAIMYSTRLMNPSHLNWVRLEWVWL